jgi:hypothetical protein
MNGIAMATVAMIMALGISALAGGLAGKRPNSIVILTDDCAGPPFFVPFVWRHDLFIQHHPW